MAYQAKRHWTPEHEEQLLAAVANNASMAALAKELGRTENALRLRLKVVAHRLLTEETPVDRIATITGLKPEEITVDKLKFVGRVPGVSRVPARRWDEESITKLLAGVSEGKARNDLASELDRTYSAVTIRLKKEAQRLHNSGVPLDEIRRTTGLSEREITLEKLNGQKKQKHNAASAAAATQSADVSAMLERISSDLAVMTARLSAMEAGSQALMARINSLENSVNRGSGTPEKSHK